MAVKAPYLPYGKQEIDEDDIAAVCETLRGDWLTTGPKVTEFESALAEYLGVKHAVVVSSGTAALHAAFNALHLSPDDEVIVPAITFAASANAVIYTGAKPVFADIDPETLLITPETAMSCITPRTKAILAVDYAGHPCDYQGLTRICDQHGITLLSDSCHSLGAKYYGKTIAQLVELSTYSFHPVKHITTGEGGMIATNNDLFATSLKTFRSHGISSDHRQREAEHTHYYEMVELGYNYRLSDINCALGLRQLQKLNSFLARRRALARHYDELLSSSRFFTPLTCAPNIEHAYHLYVVRSHLAQINKTRDDLFKFLRNEKIGANVHYLPVYRHPFYRETLNYSQTSCPAAEEAYRDILTLPLFPGMTSEDVERVVEKLLAFTRL